MKNGRIQRKGFKPKYWEEDYEGSNDWELKGDIDSMTVFLILKRFVQIKLDLHQNLSIDKVAFLHSEELISLTSRGIQDIMSGPESGRFQKNNQYGPVSDRTFGGIRPGKHRSKWSQISDEN